MAIDNFQIAEMIFRSQPKSFAESSVFSARHIYLARYLLSPVRLSITWVDQSKNGSPIPPVFAG